MLSTGSAVVIIIPHSQSHRPQCSERLILSEPDINTVPKQKSNSLPPPSWQSQQHLEKKRTHTFSWSNTTASYTCFLKKKSTILGFLTYPALGKGKLSTQQCLGILDMLGNPGGWRCVFCWGSPRPYRLTALWGGIKGMNVFSSPWRHLHQPSEKPWPSAKLNRTAPDA